ncbi:MAG: phosphoribosyltransferase family protein [Clostridium sp.]|uniref:phosphoribosyltransferase family protein n=1 Tax=Clostridium sp. TaxID=1506 RepID=UPI003F30CD38
MNKVIQEYRDSVFIIDNGELKKIEFEKWGAGELKISTLPKFENKVVTVVIPYFTFSTLEKAYVLNRFLKKKGYCVKENIIGYFSYSRQERETESEPELLNSVLITARHMLNNIVVIDGHNNESFDRYGVQQESMLPILLSKINEEYFVVAPDKGAKARNSKIGIDTHICLNKSRENGQVHTVIGEVSDKVVDGKTFVIVDDICDGGRTFVNAANIIKEDYPNSKVVLLVTHAILPFGIDNLKNSGIDYIITSDTCFPLGEYYDGFVKVR